VTNTLSILYLMSITANLDPQSMPGMTSSWYQPTSDMAAPFGANYLSRLDTCFKVKLQFARLLTILHSQSAARTPRLWKHAGRGPTSPRIELLVHCTLLSCQCITWIIHLFLHMRLVIKHHLSRLIK
jgi:hypothetical protein